MINKIKNDIKERMEKSIEALKDQINKVYIGRISPNILNSIVIKYYGASIPLRQLANITTEDSYTLIITVFDSNLVQIIKKAIIKSNLDLNLSLTGTKIRVSFPPLTEERRKNLIKIVRNDIEQSKISIRNVRRDANNKIKILLKDKEISEDDERRAQNEIQKLTDDFIKKISKVLEQKEKELMEF